MGTQGRRNDAPLIDAMVRRPGSFNFFQAVQLLEARANAQRGAVPVGGDGPPAREVVRFRSSPSLSFAAGEIEELELEGDAGRALMTVNFIGLIGAAGVLPQHYTEHLLRREQAKDRTLTDFLDIFHHRAVSLFYGAWKKYAFPQSGRSSSEAADDPVVRSLYSLVGLGTPGLRGGQGVHDLAWIFYGGHFARRTRTASGLEAIVSDACGFSVRVEQFVGRWIELPANARTQLTASPTPAQRPNSGLGTGMLLGTQVWDLSSKINLIAGPLTADEYRRFMPGTSGFARLCALIRGYVGQNIDFDLHLILEDDQAPPTQLLTRSEHAHGLGFDTWLRTNLDAALPGAAVVHATPPRVAAPS